MIFTVKRRNSLVRTGASITRAASAFNQLTDAFVIAISLTARHRQISGQSAEPATRRSTQRRPTPSGAARIAAPASAPSQPQINKDAPWGRDVVPLASDDEQARVNMWGSAATPSRPAPLKVPRSRSALPVIVDWQLGQPFAHRLLSPVPGRLGAYSLRRLPAPASAACDSCHCLTPMTLSTMIVIEAASKTAGR